MRKKVGWIALWRQFEEHPDWREPRVFSRAEAWIYLIMKANWIESIARDGTSVSRGEILTSLRLLAHEWAWSVGKVARYLDGLKNIKQLEFKTEQRRTKIRLVNYEKYQSVIQDGETKTEQPVREKRKHINNITNKQINNTPCVCKVSVSSEDYEKLVSKFNKQLIDESIDFLQSWIDEDTSGKRAKDYAKRNHAIAIQRWVLTAVQERKQRAGNKTQIFDSQNIRREAKIFKADSRDKEFFKNNQIKNILKIAGGN